MSSIFHGWAKDYLIHADATQPELAGCSHIATLTAPLHIAHGQRIYTTHPITVCVTCLVTVDLEETPWAT